MDLSKKLQKQATKEIVACMGNISKKKALTIATKRLDDAVADITKFYADDSMVGKSIKPSALAYLRRAHRKLSMAMLTAFPGVQEETACRILDEITA